MRRSAGSPVSFGSAKGRLQGMKITRIKGWYVIDEERPFAIGHHHGGDREEAVAAEHSCESSCCDVCHSLAAGFGVVAADLLGSAFESRLLAAVDRAHRFNGTAQSLDREGEWQRWLEYFGQAEEEGRLWQCEPCGSSNWDSGECGCCRAPRPVWKLTHAAYCGMVSELESDAYRHVVRSRAAYEVRCARRKGFDVVTRSRGAEWEVLEPQGCCLVPDECGTLSLELSS